MLQLDFIQPNWPAPTNVRSLQTTRVGGISVGPYSSLNLGAHVGDNQVLVEHNRQLLAPYLPSSPVWINQVHGIGVINAASSSSLQDADASYSKLANVVCATMTADCLPVLLCDNKGTVVSAVHAGWRGLCDGVIEAAVREMAVPVSEVLAWLGPAIGPQSFEVGDDVRTQFITIDPSASLAFKPHSDKWLCDIYLLAKQRLQSIGVSQIYGATINVEFCTYSEVDRFYSFRRDNVTGRMASLIWLESL
jgi:YfiH family protein